MSSIRDKAEKIALGLLMAEDSDSAYMLGVLAEDSFHREDHKAIFRAIRELHDQTTPTDGPIVGWDGDRSLVAPVANVLLRAGLLETVGGERRLRKLANKASTAQLNDALVVLCCNESDLHMVTRSARNRRVSLAN